MKASVTAILMTLAIVVELIFVPLFLKAQRPGISKTSRLYKMICATMFVLIGILSCVYSGNKSEFAVFMLIGLGLSWIGDLFLHINGKKYFIVGFISFSAAHVFYIIAYSKASSLYFHEKAFLSLYEIIAVACLEFIMFIVYKFIKKMDMKSPPMIACAFYGIVLQTMLVKSFVFSMEYLKLGKPDGISAALCLLGGGVMFFLSDTSLAPLMFHKPDRHNHSLKDFNIDTYFTAQTLLAFSMLFIGV